MFTRKCEMCGMEFQTASNRAKYCKYCRDKVQVLRNKAYKEKKESGTSVKIGSEQVCPLCGKAFTVTSGSQNIARTALRRGKKHPQTPNTSKVITIIFVSTCQRVSVRRSRNMLSLRV